MEKRRHLSGIFKSVIFLSAAICSSCTSKSTSWSPDPQAAQSVPIPQGIAVQKAPPGDCAKSGSIYLIYLDENKNGRLDEGEKIVNSQTVCDGIDGSNGASGASGSTGAAGHDGLSTLFSLNRVATGFTACPSGSGLQINSGLDLNRSGSLDSSEISNVQILCDGQTGGVGAPGKNGHSLVFQVLSAAIPVCPAGGATVLMALDILDGGTYSPLLPHQQSMTLCNGESGRDGKDGVTPAYTPVSPILPCGNTVAFKEVLLRLSNGQVLSSFSNDASGNMTRLAFLPDGTFIDTDSSNCSFTLSSSSDGSLRSISWSGAVQMTWPLAH